MGKKRLAAALVLALAVTLGACAQKQSTAKKSGADSGKHATAPQIESFLAVDQEWYAITVEGIEKGKRDQYIVDLSLENKTDDKELLFRMTAVSGDDLLLEAYCTPKVKAGKTVKEQVVFRENPNYDMWDFRDLKFTFDVEDAADIGARRDMPDVFHIYPYGESSGTSFVRRAGENERVLEENENFRVTLLHTGFEDGAYCANLYLENIGDKPYFFEFDNVSADDCMMHESFDENLDVGEKAFLTVSCEEEELKKYQLTEVKKLEFTLRAGEGRYFFDEPTFEKTFTVTAGEEP